MKKALSLILALAMMLSMVTFAHADEPAAEATDITITYWNANTTTVVLELSRKVENAQALKDAMTISGFTADDFTVKEQTSPNGQYTDAQLKTDTGSESNPQPTYSFRKLVPNNTTYTVQLASGKNFAFGTEYTLTVAESLFGSTTELKFTVNKIAVDTLATQGPWHASTASNLKFDEGVLALNKHRAKLNHQSTEVFGDTGVQANTWRNSDTSNPTRDRINMEVDVSVVNTSADHHVSIGFANNTHTWAVQSGSYSGFAGLGFGGNSSGERTFSVFVAKAGADPKADYGNLTSGVYYAAQSHGNVFGNMAYNGPSRAWPVTGKTSLFASGEYKHMAYFYDAASDTEDGRVTLGVEDEFYNYVHDMQVTNLRANPHFVTSGSKAYFKNLIISYPTGSIRTIKITTVPVEAPVSWNAASDTITLDFNTDVTASALEDAITLVDPDGEEIAVTVTKLADVTKSGYGTGRHAYKISLPAGTRFADEEAYKLTISSAVSLVDDGDEYTFHKLAQDYVLNFKVDLFVVEEFNYEEGAQAISLDTDTRENDGTIVAENELPWSLSMSSKKGTMTIAKDGDNKYAKVNVTGKAFFSPYADNDVNFANTNMDGRAFADSTLKDVSEFTTEMDLKVVSTSNANGAYDVRLYETKLAYSTGWASNYNNQLISMVVWSSASSPYNKLMRPAAHSLANGGSYYSSNTQQTSVSKSKAEAANWPAVGGDYVRVSVSEKDGNHKFLIGNAVTSMDHDASLSAVNNAIPALGFNENNTSVTSEYHIDNIILSKATEIEIASSTEFGDLAVTVGGEAIDTLAGQTAVDVSVPVTRVGAALPVKAVVAVYNTATNEMTNVVMSTITSIADSTTFSFENVALNGGNALSVYFWENFETLLPYVVPFNFPAAQ